MTVAGDHHHRTAGGAQCAQACIGECCIAQALRIDHHRQQVLRQGIAMRPGLQRLARHLLLRVRRRIKPERCGQRIPGERLCQPGAQFFTRHLCAVDHRIGCHCENRIVHIERGPCALRPADQRIERLLIAPSLRRAGGLSGREHLENERLWLQLCHPFRLPRVVGGIVMLLSQHNDLRLVGRLRDFRCSPESRKRDPKGRACTR